MANIYLDLELHLDEAKTDPTELKIELEKLNSERNKKITIDIKFKDLVAKAKKYIDDGLENLDLERQKDIARKECFKKLREAVAEIRRTGFVEESEFRLLTTHFPYFSEDTIKKELGPISEGFKPPSPRPEGVNEVPIEDMEEMAKSLRMIENGKYADLYGLLSLARTSSAEELYKAAKEASLRNLKVAIKTAEVDAKNTVFGKAIVIFKDKDSKAGYDAALRRRPFDELCLSKFAFRAASKNVTQEDYDLSIEETREKAGYKQNEAEWLVYDYYCNKRKCPPPRRKVTVKQGYQCPTCYKFNDTAASVCKECGSPLKLSCPKCKKESLSDVNYCPCGFSLGNMLNAISLLKRAREEFSYDRIEDAKSFLRQANIYFRNNPEATKLREEIDEREKTIKEEKEKNKVKIEKENKQIAEIEQKIRELLGKKHLFEAERFFAELKSVAPNSTFLQNEVKVAEDELKKIRHLLTGAKQQDAKAQLDTYEDIIVRATDCAEAKAALEKFPPLPPEGMTITELPSGFSLQWQPPKVKRLPVYRVVRKSKGVPSSPQDGDVLIDDLEKTQYTDSSIVVGATYGYAVFSKRGNQIEKKGCCTQLVQLRDDVKDLKAVPGDNVVSLSWKKMEVSDIRVTRYAGDTASGEGKQMHLQSRSRIVDQGAKNGKTYTYLVQAVFKTPDGKNFVTEGKTVTCRPQVPPPLVTDLTAEIQEREQFLLQWTPQADSKVAIIEVDENAPIPAEGAIEFTELTLIEQRFGQSIPLATDSSAVWKNTRNGQTTLLPVSLRDGLAVYGKPVSVIKLADVKNAFWQACGVKLYLRWDWFDEKARVLLLYRHDQSPTGFDDGESFRKIITHAEYIKEDGIALPYTGEQNYYFLLYTFIEHGDKPVYSKGVRLQTKKTMINYALRFRQNGGETQAILEIQGDQETGLPAFVIRKKNERCPLDRNDGMPLQVTVAEVAAPRRSVIIPGNLLEQDTFIRLFVKASEQSVMYRVIDPPQRKLELYPQ